MNEINRNYSVNAIISNSYSQMDRPIANPIEYCANGPTSADNVSGQNVITKVSSNHGELQSGNVLPTSETSRTNVRLLHSDMWHAFAAIGTEMIITKAGRYISIKKYK